jgi:hypothetical protein
MKTKLDFAALIVSILALIISAYTYKQTENIQKETTAYTLWQQYLQLTVAYPELAQGMRLKSDSVCRRYEWFVANTLGAAEIVYNFQSDPLWHHTIKEVLSNHAEYFKSNSFKQGLNDYDPKLVKIIEEVIKESDEKRFKLSK